MVMEVNEKHDGDLVRLKCSVKEYDWGRIGLDSLVARLFLRNCNDKIEESKHYAEFWMGTHASGPSFIAEEKGVGNVSLKSWISKNPEVLGDTVVDKWGIDLPFMFKVLSVAQALSIQAHPDKELAGLLHTLKSNVYKDANHKPEMVLALTEFEALCGFISFEELETVLESVPEIMEVVGGAYADEVLPVNEEAKEAQFLRSIFIKLMSAGSKVVSVAVSKLINRLDKENKVPKYMSLALLMLCLDHISSREDGKDDEGLDVFLQLQEESMRRSTAGGVTGLKERIDEAAPRFLVQVFVSRFRVLSLRLLVGPPSSPSLWQPIGNMVVIGYPTSVLGDIAPDDNSFFSSNQTRQLTSKEELALKLEKQYPDDIGVIASFLFNHVRLNPGEALYVASNEIHAYVGGECVECMATSDNVVRAGLTPKNRDVKILCSMLTYKQGPPEILKGVPVNAYTKRYNPPFEEFEVDRCMLDQGASVVFPAVPGPSIFLVLSGQGSMYTSVSSPSPSSPSSSLFSSPSSSTTSSSLSSPSSSLSSPFSSLSLSSPSLSPYEDTVHGGDVLFVPANTEVHVSTESELHLYRAGVNHMLFSKTSM
ncbi:Mannose-6-phosphate isomerase [Cynara cardunculus var. scolymus]|uniref:mannose-6-phosphate isomerase n=1 Tax=Cynara cardunculus var. scolymus TaxID=59895 RepID=A0A118K011_CYNCS|nr:Mannose-6-phosphate isomerase [Cynara cardunculus var. scolymus]